MEQRHIYPIDSNTDLVLIYDGVNVYSGVIIDGIDRVAPIKDTGYIQPHEVDAFAERLGFIVNTEKIMPQLDEPIKEIKP